MSFFFLNNPNPSPPLPSVPQPTHTKIADEEIIEGGKVKEKSTVTYFKGFYIYHIECV